MKQFIRKKFALKLACACASACVSLGANAQKISLVGETGSLTLIEKQTTQTQIKPGWKIVDVKLKDKVQRYLWGAHAKDFTFDARPAFVVDTDSLLLSNLVLVELKEKGEYRRMYKPSLCDNDPVFVNLNSFSIEPYGEDDALYLIRPTTPLDPGEYIFSWHGAPSVGKMQDIYVWPFCVKEAE